MSCTIPTWCDMSGRYLDLLNMMLEVRSPAICMEKYMLGEINPLYKSQYLEGLISTVTRGGLPVYPKKKSMSCMLEIWKATVGREHHVIVKCHNMNRIIILNQAYRPVTLNGHGIVSDHFLCHACIRIKAEKDSKEQWEELPLKPLIGFSVGSSHHEAIFILQTFFFFRGGGWIIIKLET